MTRSLRGAVAEEPVAAGEDVMPEESLQKSPVCFKVEGPRHVDVSTGPCGSSLCSELGPSSTVPELLSRWVPSRPWELSLTGVWGTPGCKALVTVRAPAAAALCHPVSTGL